MITDRQGRAGWNQATPKTSESTCNSTDLAPRIKGFIFILDMCVWLRVGLADWHIHSEALRDE